MSEVADDSCYSGATVLLGLVGSIESGVVVP